jgi:ribosomal-protein-alanine N-acetyltransferase
VAEDIPELPRELSTERLLLRPFCFEDVDSVAEYANDEAWSHFLPVPYPYSRKDAEAFVASAVLRDWLTKPQWAVTLDGRAIGGHNLRFFAQHRVAEMGWGIGAAHWGRGFGTEAAHIIVHTAFRTVPGLERIAARAHPENVASRRLMEKIGMVHEATIRKNRVFNNEVVDEVCYGILRQEWTTTE